MTEDLATLPVDHPLRNTPLIRITTAYRWIHGTSWKSVKPTWPIAGLSYNQLGEVWTKWSVWRGELQQSQLGFCQY